MVRVIHSYQTVLFGLQFSRNSSSPPNSKEPHICLLFRLGDVNQDYINPLLFLLFSTLFPTAEGTSPHMGIDFRWQTVSKSGEMLVGAKCYICEWFPQAYKLYFYKLQKKIVMWYSQK